MRVFVTGASGWIGSAVVPELIDAGHRVTGLARSDASAAALVAAGADVERGTLDDLDILRKATEASDGAIHLAFKHDVAFSGGFEAAADADRRAVETMGEVLTGSGRPFVLASGMLGLAPGRVATENDTPDPTRLSDGFRTRMGTAELTQALGSQGVRSSVLRLPPTVHGDGDHGFVAALVRIARDKGVSGYVADGANRWPAVHRLDAARLFRLALEKAPAGSVLHPVGDEGVPARIIAEIIGRQLGVPVASVSPEDVDAHFGWIGPLFAMDSPASAALTRELLGWEPTHPTLVEDLSERHYFTSTSA